MKNEELLAEIENLLRTAPARSTIHHETDENFSWFGRVLAVINQWYSPKSISAQGYIDRIQSTMARDTEGGYSGLKILLNQARHDLILKTEGSTSVAIEGEKPFQYFDELRKIIELAQGDILFVDPYMEAEFVSRYLPFVPDGVRVRLLVSGEIKKTLVPAVQMFVSENGVDVEVRSTPELHDRFIFLDGRECYLSGASFKDGAKKAPAAIAKITDSLSAMLNSYETLWESGTVVEL